ncbi:nuclear transport factor 2 family protein [Pseudomonas sp. PDM14]|uniref:nuclear transport factor 2 family protein n=1 Tax=Pseudomonas sp. PDM14 TaxID=2769288 RepID=UPI00177DCE61|nr:nuclear transport factor 2 family protein [Pseudomonas sp. PDM14]MBD9485150.1 nuclear transport factor 2 family protein [Pseudomonas sp. PDM14]
MTDFLQRFAAGFASLNKDNLQRVAELYSADIHFRDPLHDVQGLDPLRAYYEQLYANVRELRFDFHGYDTLADGEGYLRWTMHYRHPRLAGGRPLQLDGCSHLRWRAERVYYHRDYFDAGALLYEHLPLFGALIRWLKGRLA